MDRKQMYLTEDITRDLERLAEVEGKSVAEVTRELLREALDKRVEKKKPVGLVLMDLAKNAVDGPGDMSTHLTDYLYGAKSPKYGHLADKNKK